MLDELLEFDWKQVNLRKPPATSALAEQIALSLDPTEEWLLSALEMGYFAGEDGERVGSSWPMDKPLYISTTDLMTSHGAHVQSWSGSSLGVQRVIKFLSQHGTIEKVRLAAERPGGERKWGYRLGPLADWRVSFARDHKVTFHDESTEVSNVIDLAGALQRRLAA